MQKTLHFPELLEICVIDTSTGCSVSNIALMLTIFAAEKNNYHIALVTDTKGRIGISVADICKSIKADQELFPMDYVSSLEECSKDIEIKICNPDEVKKAIVAMKMFRSVNVINEELIKGFEASQNKKYIPTSQHFSLHQKETYVVLKIMVNPREK